MWTDILTAVALVLVIEGLIPFLSPSTYKAAIQAVLAHEHRVLRIFGLSSMMAGVILLTIVR